MGKVTFQPRPRQREVLAYTGGKMGVSAVPGSGKTHTLSCLAAQLVASGALAEDQEVLIVTLVNSAVDNFKRRVNEFVRQRGLLPNVGYRVRTLHGLAHDIVRERPALVGLSEDFQILDEPAAERLREDAAEAWLRAHPDAAPLLESLERADLEERQREDARRKGWPRLISDIALAFIRQAKDLRLTPADLQARLEASPQSWPLVEMGAAIYADYQRALAYRGAVDFDDLVRLALLALESAPDYLERLRHRWPFILEDEAQDSSRLQEEILRLLVGPQGNWVRVGDPNQAIYETFTTASPRFLRDFLKEEGVQPRELPDSGRSTRSIINLANLLMDWTRADHPCQEARQALSLPHIEPAPPDDPQPNPPDNPMGIRFVAQRLTPEEELRAVVDSLARWLPKHPEATVAALVPRNDRGFELVAALKQRGIPYVEILRSTHSTREAAAALATVLQGLADPISPKHLAETYRVWRQRTAPEEEKVSDDPALRLLRGCDHVEEFLWPRAGRDWLDTVPADLSMVALRLATFRDLLQRWQAAVLLPIDQLLLTVAQDLFREPSDLAVAHKLALLLRRISESRPGRSLADLAQELTLIAQNERTFLGLSEDDTGFDPDQHKGKVVVATMHKAKGLEWDRVYLVSLNNYDFPSALPGDRFIAEKWFTRDGLNLEAETVAQLRALAGLESDYVEGRATEQARLDYAAERLRLLYVGITRARKELIMTWNTGHYGDQQPAAPFIALQTLWGGET